MYQEFSYVIQCTYYIQGRQIKDMIISGVVRMVKIIQPMHRPIDMLGVR
jgi:hypothetical protein